MQSERVGLESAVILCKHQSEQCNLMTVIFYNLSKHLAGIFVWTNFNLRLFACREVVHENNVVIILWRYFYPVFKYILGLCGTAITHIII